MFRCLHRIYADEEKNKVDVNREPFSLFAIAGALKSLFPFFSGVKAFKTGSRVNRIESVDPNYRSRPRG
jgi:hypothetical protein